MGLKTKSAIHPPAKARGLLAKENKRRYKNGYCFKNRNNSREK